VTVDLTLLRKAADGPDLDEVPVTRRMLRAIAKELADGRLARAMSSSRRGRVQTRGARHCGRLPP
jgi:hypothetical protein